MWPRDSRRPDYRDDRSRYADYPPYPSSSRRSGTEDERDRYHYARVHGEYGYPPDREREREYAYSRDRERERDPAYGRDRERERRIDRERERERDRDLDRQRPSGYGRERDDRDIRGWEEAEREGRYRDDDGRMRAGEGPETIRRPMMPPVPANREGGRPFDGRPSIAFAADAEGLRRPASPSVLRPEQRRSKSPNILLISSAALGVKDDFGHSSIAPRALSSPGNAPRRASPTRDISRHNEPTRRPSGAFAGASPPHGPRAHALRAPPRGPSVWSARGAEVGGRHAGPNGAPTGPARRDDPPPRSLARKRDSEGALLVPDLAPIPSPSSAAGPAISSHDAGRDELATTAPTTMAAVVKKEDPAIEPSIKPYSGTHARSSTSKDVIHSPSTTLSFVRTHTHSTRPFQLSYTIDLPSDISSALQTYESARRLFLTDFTSGPTRSSIRTAQFEQRDAQMELVNASHRVQLCQQALESTKEEAEKYTLTENQKDWAAEQLSEADTGTWR